MKTFAVIETGGKQYMVQEGDVVKIELLAGEEGEKVTFDKVLLVDDGSKTDVGSPYISGKKVMGEIVENGRDKKISVMRFKKKTTYRRHYGHRQPFTMVKIENV